MITDHGRALLLLAALGLAACAAPTVREVAELKELAAAGNVDAIVAYEVACQPTTVGCAQAHVIQADACLGRAQTTSVVARAPYAACATEGFGLALDAATAVPDPSVDPARLGRARLEANRLWRDAVTRAEGAELNARLAERAARVATAEPARPEGPYYLADARVWPVNAGLEPEPCAAIQAAILLANEAAVRQSAGAVDVAQLQRDLANAALARGCDLPS